MMQQIQQKKEENSYWIGAHKKMLKLYLLNQYVTTQVSSKEMCWRQKFLLQSKRIFGSNYWSYKEIPPEQAVEDFKKRIAEYEKSYQPLDESDSQLSEYAVTRCLTD